MSNAFKGRQDKNYVVPGIKFKKSIVKTFKLVNQAKVLEGSKDAVIVCEPVLQDEFDVKEVVKNNARGHSIKDIASRVLAGDPTILNNNVHYGNGTIIPTEKIEIMKAHNDLVSSVNSLSKEEYDTLKQVLKMSDKEILDLVNSRKAVNDEVNEKNDHVEPQPDEKKEGN